MQPSDWLKYVGSSKAHGGMATSLTLARVTNFRSVALHIRSTRIINNVPLLRWQCRSYARGMSRRIVNILSSDQEIEKLRERGIAINDPKKNAYLPYIPEDPVQKNIQRCSSRPTSQKEKKKQSEKKIKASDVATMKMETLQEGSKQLGKMMQMTKSRKHREKNGLILLEGHRLVRDALRVGASLQMLFISREDLLQGLPKDKLANAEIYKVPYREVRVWSDTQTPSGILAVMKQPGQGEAIHARRSYLPLTLVCDTIRDPGNMGTLIRTAAAAGCQRLLITKGCVDVWEAKVLRAAMGGHFFLPIHWGLDWTLVKSYCSPGTQVVLADPRPSASLPPEVALKLLENAREEADYSLPEESEKRTSSAGDVEDSSDGESDEETLELYRSAPIPHSPYSSLQSIGNEVMLIIGGETQGASPQAKKLTFESFGQCVTIPMDEGIDSLNSAVAGSIILYDLRRQLIEKLQKDSEKSTGNAENAA